MSNAKKTNTTNSYLEKRSALLDSHQVLAATDDGEPASVSRGYVAECDHLNDCNDFTACSFEQLILVSSIWAELKLADIRGCLPDASKGRIKDLEMGFASSGIEPRNYGFAAVPHDDDDAHKVSEFLELMATIQPNDYFPAASTNGEQP